MSASASASFGDKSLTNINNFSYVVIDIGTNDTNLNEQLHSLTSRIIRELSVEAQVVSDVPEHISMYILEHATNCILRQVPDPSVYHVSDEDLGQYMNSKLVIHFPEKYAYFMDLMQTINYITNHLNCDDKYELTGLSFVQSTQGNVAIAELSYY